jgi:hypothetical protein
MVAVLLKFLTYLCIPVLAIWYLFASLAAPFAGFMPVYFKILLSPVWFVTSFFVALLGWKRQLGFWVYFLISLLLSPIVGILVVLVSGKKSRQQPDNQESA